MKPRPALPLRLDLRSKTPAYLQIVEQVRALAAAGVLRPGDQLPTIRRMADECGIHFNTVARAYRLLDEGGVISTQHGRGTYAVASRASARRSRARVLDTLVRRLLGEAARLGSGPDEVRLALGRATGPTRPRPSPRDGKLVRGKA